MGSNGIAFGPDGRLYVAEFLGGRISAVDLDNGDLDVVVPAGGPVRSPDDLAFGADGSMYIADLVPGRVWRRSPQGAYTLVSDAVNNPNGITCIGDRLFVNEMKPDGRLLELFPDGGRPTVLTAGLAMGNAMQRGPDGCLYYPHMMSEQIWRIPPDGGAPEMVADQVDRPVAVRFDRGGVLHVLSLGPEGRVTRIDLHGTGSRTLVTSGLAGLDNAAFDAENRMFVSSYASGGITEMHPDGRTSVIVPRGFDGPYGVTVDLGGTVYAADHYRVASPGVPRRRGRHRCGRGRTDQPGPRAVRARHRGGRWTPPPHLAVRRRPDLRPPAGVDADPPGRAEPAHGHRGGPGGLARRRRDGRRPDRGRRRERQGHGARGRARPPGRRGLRRGGAVLRQ